MAATEGVVFPTRAGATAIVFPTKSGATAPPARLLYVNGGRLLSQQGAGASNRSAGNCGYLVLVLLTPGNGTNCPGAGQKRVGRERWAGLNLRSRRFSSTTCCTASSRRLAVSCRRPAGDPTPVATTECAAAHFPGDLSTLRAEPPPPASLPVPVHTDRSSTSSASFVTTLPSFLSLPYPSLPRACYQPTAANPITASASYEPSYSECPRVTIIGIQYGHPVRIPMICPQYACIRRNCQVRITESFTDNPYEATGSN